MTTRPVAMPHEAFEGNGATMTFGVHVRPDPEGDPTSLVRCVIPSTAAAVARVEKLFEKNEQAARGSGRSQALSAVGLGPTHASPMKITDPLAMIVDGSDPCDPYALTDCACADSCGGTGGGEEPTEGPPPTEPDVPAYTVSPDYAVAPTTCYGQTDRPHLSTTFGFFGRTNVHARTVCTSPLPITVGVRLERSKCFWFFCWWGTVATGFNATIWTNVEAVANESCHKGWYIGYGYHTAIWPEGPGGTTTANSNYVYC